MIQISILTSPRSFLGDFSSRFWGFFLGRGTFPLLPHHTAPLILLLCCSHPSVAAARLHLHLVTLWRSETYLTLLTCSHKSQWEAGRRKNPGKQPGQSSADSCRAGAGGCLSVKHLSLLPRDRGQRLPLSRC